MAYTVRVARDVVTGEAATLTITAGNHGEAKRLALEMATHDNSVAWDMDGTSLIQNVEVLSVEEYTVDYQSPLFEEGFAVGQAQAGTRDPLVIPPRRPEWSDDEWTTFAEGVLMGSCEPPDTDWTPR